MMRPKIVAALPMLLLLLVSAIPAPAREWTDSSGVFKVEAELVKVEGRTVYLRRTDGTVVRVPLAKLSTADRAFAARAKDTAGAQTGAAVLEDKLAEPVNFEFVDTPLADVLAYFRNLTDLHFHTDRRALAKAGIDPRQPVTARGRRMRFDHALGATLEPLELQWYVHRSGAIVVTAEAAAPVMTPRVYRLLQREPLDDIIEQITELIAPRTWEDVGGPGSVAPASASLLVIRQSHSVHRRIAERFAKRLAWVRVPAAAAGGDALEAALAAQTNAEFVDTPLEEIVNYLADLRRINVALDRTALDGAGVDARSPITFSAAGFPLADILDLMLLDLELAWIVDKGRVLITTPEEAETRMQVATHAIGGIRGASADAVADALRRTIAPATWSRVGGSGRIQESGRGKLAVRQSYPVQRQIRLLLAELEAASQR